MPNGKPSVDEDLDDDPFEGLELGDDAPEPTQEEMDEWATLDTPDEDSSPTLGARSQSADEPVAPSSTAPPPDAKKIEKDEPDYLLKENPSKEGDVDNPQATPSLSTASALLPVAPEVQPQALPAATDSQLEELPVQSPPVAATAVPRPTQLSEITPATSPPPSQTTTKQQQQSYADEDDSNDEEEDDDSENETRQPLQQQEEQRQSGGGGWGVGWGTGWGLGALGGKLREVAAGAVRDVKDLTETFQAALADVTGAEDEVEQARRISALDRAAAAAAAGGSTAEVGDVPGGKDGEASAPAAPTDAPRQAAEPAREGAVSRGGAGPAAGVSAPGRSEGGAIDQAPDSPADPALEAGLQAIDSQVEQLATGAARAFSSLWGGLSSVAKVVAAEVAASVADVGQLGSSGVVAVRGVAEIGSRLAHTAEKGLETVGRTAMVLLEEVAGVGAGGGGHAGRRRIWGEEADARAADMGREPTSFQDFFYIYGGEQLTEEVSNLSNECAHLCNKSRSKLEGDQQKALDDALGRLGPYFNDLWVGGKAAGDAGDEAVAYAPQPAFPKLNDSSREAAERLGAMYDPIGYLCQDSLARSEAFLHQLRNALAAARAAEADASAEGKHGSSKQPKGDEPEEEGEEDEAAALLRRQRQAEEPRALLETFRLHFTKRLAEVTTAQLQLLLSLGASLAAPARTGRPAVDGISWPESSEQQAALLAGEARRMVADLQAIAAAYAATISALRSAPLPEAAVAQEDADGSDAPPATEANVKVLEEMAAVLAANSESAAATIKGGYKGMLYAVLLHSLVTTIAQQGEEDEKEPQEQQSQKPVAVDGGAVRRSP